MSTAPTRCALALATGNSPGQRHAFRGREGEGQPELCK